MVIELTRRGSDDVLAVACGSCGLVYTLGNRDLAEACCVCSYCNLPMTGGRVGSEHASCSSARWAESAKKRAARHMDPADTGDAKRVAEADYSGPVYWDDHGHEGYFGSADELRRWCADRGEPLPAWVWACTVEPFGIDAEGVIESATENCGEHASDSITNQDAKRLQALLDEWVKSVDVSPTWDADNRVAVVLA